VDAIGFADGDFHGQTFGHREVSLMDFVLPPIRNSKKCG